MRAKDRKWLEGIAGASEPGSGMYRGEREDFVPSTVARRLGVFIRMEYPHNPVHKGRWVITDAGRDALKGDDQ